MSAQPRSRMQHGRAPARHRRSKERPPHLRLATVAEHPRKPKPRRKPRARGRLGKPFLFTTFFVLAVGIFGLVLLNVFLAQSSFELEELRRQVVVEEAKFRKMRLEVASAESPHRVAESASALGLVPAERQEYIVGPPGEVQVAEAEPDLNDKKLKALLGGR